MFPAPFPPTPRFPDAYVNVDQQSAADILDATSAALTGAGATPEQVTEYRKDANSGDFGHLIETTMVWVTIGFRGAAAS